MLSKNIEKLFRKLRSKKYRWQYQMFIAEGPKVVQELLDEGMDAVHIFCCSAEWQKKGISFIDEKEMKGLTQLDGANEVIAIFRFPELDDSIYSGNILVLDQLNDPGNLGTIIRTCDWFGISHIYCTTGTTDIFNAKCVQSTMGSIARVKVEYLDNEEILKRNSNRRILVADMRGHNFFELEIEGSPKALVMGSESHGPSDFWKSNAEKVTLPKVGASAIESLNVAQAAAIMISRL